MQDSVPGTGIVHMRPLNITGVGVYVHIETKGAQDQCCKDEEKNSSINATFVSPQFSGAVGCSY